MYGAGAALAFPAAWWAARLAGRPAAPARRGFLPAAAPAGVWLHGASAGEMAAALRLVRHMRRTHGDFAALYTTTNAAGLAYAARRAAPGDVCSLAPWDAPASIARAFDRVRPALLVLVETELWPRLVLEAFRRSVPVLCASARIYDRDWNGYRLARPWIAPLLRRVACVAAQDDAAQRARFVRLGARAALCHAPGNLKYLDDGQSGAAARPAGRRSDGGGRQPARRRGRAGLSRPRARRRRSRRRASSRSRRASSATCRASKRPRRAAPGVVRGAAPRRAPTGGCWCSTRWAS